MTTATKDLPEAPPFAGTPAAREHMARAHLHLAAGAALAAALTVAVGWKSFSGEPYGGVTPVDGGGWLTGFGTSFYAPATGFYLFLATLAGGAVTRFASGRAKYAVSLPLHLAFAATLGLTILAFAGPTHLASVGRGLAVAALGFATMSAIGQSFGRMASAWSALLFMGSFCLAGVWLLGQVAPHPGAPPPTASVAWAIAFAAWVASATPRIRALGEAKGDGSSPGTRALWGAMGLCAFVLALPWTVLKGLWRLPWGEFLFELLGYLLVAITFGALGGK